MEANKVHYSKKTTESRVDSCFDDVITLTCFVPICGSKLPASLSDKKEEVTCKRCLKIIETKAKE